MPAHWASLVMTDSIISGILLSKKEMWKKITFTFFARKDQSS